MQNYCENLWRFLIYIELFLYGLLQDKKIREEVRHGENIFESI